MQLYYICLIRKSRIILGFFFNCSMCRGGRAPINEHFGTTENASVTLLPCMTCGLHIANFDLGSKENWPGKQSGSGPHKAHLKQKATCQGYISLFDSQVQGSSARFLFLGVDISTSSNEQPETRHAICHHG